MKKLLIAALLLTLAIAGCKNDDDSTESINNPDKQINDWVYLVMQDVYYWTDELPTEINKNQEPEDFFETLRYEDDRFSVIVPDYDALINALDGITLDAGYELVLIQEDGTNNVHALILYVKEGSPAADAQLKRGDLIKKINGQQMTLDNYASIIDAIYTDHSIIYDRYNEGDDSYITLEASLEPVQLAETPHYLDTVYTTTNGRKVGYYVYNFFSPGPGQSTSYDDEMKSIFSAFQSNGVEELILDLRYNSGGSVSSATTLASLVAPGVDESDIFYQNQWNDNYQAYIETLDNADDILRGKFQDLPENLGEHLTQGKVYILVGSRTASASELIINGLSPYMEVEIIGASTVGKNVGSIPVEDEDNPDNDYGLLPIVLKIANSQGMSNYDNGFTPGGDNNINELQLPLKQLGDVNEPLLAQALNKIDASMGGRKIPQYGPGETALHYSLQHQIRSEKLIFSQKK